MSDATLISYGEVLWDLLPSGKVAGGAPMNVAFQAKNLGLQTQVISKVGADELGKELLEFLGDIGVGTSLIQTDQTFPTGTVKVELDENGSPSYDIVAPAAWDFIHPADQAVKAVEQTDALVFGSLACRNGRTKKTLLELLTLAKTKVFDVNLRPPHYSQPLLEELIGQADIVKMNDEELEIISGWYIENEEEREQMEFLKEKLGLDTLIVTKGGNGAVSLDSSGFYSQSGFPVKVRDTIGSGDAFLAAWVSNWLTGHTPEECLASACAAGAWVATQKGATSALSETILKDLMKQKN